MISIITPVFNQCVFTKQYLADMQASLSEEDEVIVVDNGSTDRTQEYLKEWEGPATLISMRNDRNFGFARSSNQGYQLCSGNIIIFLNNDIKIKNNKWYKKIIILQKMEIFFKYIPRNLQLRL